MMPYTQLQFRRVRVQLSTPASSSWPHHRAVFREYEVHQQEHFMPLGMTRSFFDRAPYHLEAHRSHSYASTDEGTREQRFDFDTGITVSNGGLNAPLGDMAKYLAFLIGGNETILKSSSLDEMFTPQIRAADGEGGSGDDVQAGLSCFIERHGGVELVGHSGDQNGFISHLYFHRPSKSGYIVSFNTDVTSKRDPHHTTRAVDNDLRDAIAKEFWSGGNER
jgi:CubicO group peptidase (beta-lactamase class C family)